MVYNPGCSFVKEFNCLPMNGRMISNEDLQGVLSKVCNGLDDSYDQTAIPAVCPRGELQNTHVFDGCYMTSRNFFSSIKVVDMKYKDSDVPSKGKDSRLDKYYMYSDTSKDSYLDLYFFVDSNKFNSESYRYEILSKLGDGFGFVELLNEEESLEWVLYDRTLYDIGLVYGCPESFFLYLKPNIFSDLYLYPPVLKTRLLNANLLFRFAYLQNIFWDKETYFQYTHRYFNYSDSSGIVKIFEYSIIPSSESVKEIVDYLDSLFKKGWVKEDCVFSFHGSIFVRHSRFGRKIAWKIGSGQFSGSNGIEFSRDLAKRLLEYSNKEWGLVSNINDIFTSVIPEGYRHMEGFLNNPDTDFIRDTLFVENLPEILCDLPEDFNSCVFVSGIAGNGKSGLRPDFCHRNLKNFVVPCKEFLNSKYGYDRSPFENSILYSVDFNGFCCTPETFNRSVLHESFEIKGGLGLEEDEDYSKMFNLCNYKALSGRDFRSVLKLVQSPPSNKSCSNSEDSSDILNELKGWLKSGYSLGEAKVLFNTRGVACDDVINELHVSLLEVCSKFIDLLLNPGENNGSSSEFTIGYAQRKLLAKGYPKDVVNEAIVGYIRDEYLVNN